MGWPCTPPLSFPSQQFVFPLKLDLGKGSERYSWPWTLARLSVSLSSCLSICTSFHIFSVNEIHIDTLRLPLASRMASSHRQPITAESPLLMASVPPTDTLIHWLHWNQRWCSTNAPHAWCLLWILPFMRLHNTRDVKNLFFVPLLNWICTGMLKKELQCCIWNVFVFLWCLSFAGLWDGKFQQ